MCAGEIKQIEVILGQYFPVVLFIMLYKVAFIFESVEEILSVTIEMKANIVCFSRFSVYFRLLILLTPTPNGTITSSVSFQRHAQM